MKAKFLLKNCSSVSAAAAVLLGSSGRAPANIPTAQDETAKGNGEPFEPLILKPSKVKTISEERFAGHRSHSSHSSHASHYSGSGASQPYSPPIAPVYSPPQPPAAPVYSPQQLIAPRAVPAAALEPSHRIELINGTTIYGNVLAKSAAGITLRGWDGKDYKFQRKQLSARTIAEQALPEERTTDANSATSKSQTTNAAGVEQKNTDLEQTVRALQADNAALREQLRSSGAKPSTTGAAGQPPSTLTTGQQDTSQAYWLSGTGKRHNKNCRYYGTGHGRPCGPNDGVPCKICGG